MSTRPSILITAGPTHEPIDAVRYIANRSSGSLGSALAFTASRRGHPTTLLLGPVLDTFRRNPKQTLPTITHSTRYAIHRFTTTADLQSLLADHATQADLIIMAAAVADYRPATSSPNEKIPRSSDTLTLTLEKTPDLVAQLVSNRTNPNQRIVAFALEEQDNLIERATAKLARKGVDAIVANPLETMDSKYISAHLIFPDRDPIPTPRRMYKHDFADWLLDQLL